jgi:glycosyltransferase involved in cell wall biosynthesis
MESSAVSDCVIVVPCYNEALRLDVAAFQRFAAQCPTCRFLMVDDGSRDRTVEVLEELEAKLPACFSVFRMGQNRGKAEAVRQGILRALDDEARLVGFWDADLATPLSTIPEFLAEFQADPRLQVVLGSRVKLLGRRIERQPMRHYLGRVFATAASMILSLPVYDTQCGAKMFRASALVRRMFAEPFCSRWFFDVELLARLMIASTDGPSQVEDLVHELPLREWRDVAGSKLRHQDFVRALVDLTHLGWLYGRRCAAMRKRAITKSAPAAEPSGRRRAA